MVLDQSLDAFTGQLRKASDMAKKRPDKVRVGCVWFDILWKDDRWERSSNSIAQCDSKCHTLTFGNCATGTHLAASFAHELFHAAAYVISRNDDSIKCEDAADIAGYQFVDVWIDNPEVFDWWISLVKGDTQ